MRNKNKKHDQYWVASAQNFRKNKKFRISQIVCIRTHGASHMLVTNNELWKENRRIHWEVKMSSLRGCRPHAWPPGGRLPHLNTLMEQQSLSEIGSVFGREKTKAIPGVIFFFFIQFIQSFLIHIWSTCIILSWLKRPSLLCVPLHRPDTTTQTMQSIMPAVWVKMGSSWLGLGLYLWTLVAPLIFPDRDFS